MKRILAAVAAGFLATGAWAGADDIVRVKAEGDVDKVMDALELAVEGAGATVFARVDHATGAEEAGMYIAPSQVLIFGNPKIGTLAMQDDPLAGLYLPMKVLVYRDGDGQVWLAYEEPGEMLDDAEGISDDAEYLGQMREALEALTAKAAKG
ncbi:DUF302 domain-containing protein [Roseovarius sp. SCSIO 43702]|uniref:DUF302 domain-containing protein n=1 Tax=Roseovarius sp. SCSIO 43702 TaxID=2823043 RepID=UPI001C730DC4|nr:DUF302 domain-containing protein [Roseovarius sp. SCSIO 43702]QYX55737.1 DUF302 domain-containing protein [Roseovarius sp. SCSIO 43702]